MMHGTMNIKNPTDTSAHYVTLMTPKLELQKHLMKLCYNSLLYTLHSFIHSVGTCRL